MPALLDHTLAKFSGLWHPGQPDRRKSPRIPSVTIGTFICMRPEITGFTAPYMGLPVGTRLTSLDALTLIDLLESFQANGHCTDSFIVTVHLDAKIPHWRCLLRDREKASSRDTGGRDRREGPRAPTVSSPSNAESAYDVLGVLPTTSFAEIAEAFRATMLSLQNLPNNAPQRRLIEAFKEIKRQRAAG
jgi:hypothetical protein